MKNKIVFCSEPAKELNGVKLRNRTLKFREWAVIQIPCKIKITTNGKNKL